MEETYSGKVYKCPPIIILNRVQVNLCWWRRQGFQKLWSLLPWWLVGVVAVQFVAWARHRGLITLLQSLITSTPWVVTFTTVLGPMKHCISWLRLPQVRHQTLNFGVPSTTKSRWTNLIIVCPCPTCFHCLWLLSAYWVILTEWSLTWFSLLRNQTFTWERKS